MFWVSKLAEPSFMWSSIVSFIPGRVKKMPYVECVFHPFSAIYTLQSAVSCKLQFLFTSTSSSLLHLAFGLFV
jgi:hypothetical protein